MINKLPLNLSIYLNLLRILAILAVVMISAQSLFHLNIFGPTTRLFGNEPAIVFFVISGFLTQYNFKEHKHDRRSFLISRSSRIYSAVFVAILLCIGLDALGHAARPGFYQALEARNLYTPFDMFALIQHLTFTHESWIFHAQLGAMTTFWALGYIVMFYLFFAFTAYRRHRLIVLAILWFFLAGVPLALYLLIWFMGVETYNFMKKYRTVLGPQSALYVFVFTLLAFLAGIIFVGPTIASPLQQRGDYLVIGLGYLYHLAIALLVVLNLISFERLFRYAPVPSIETEATVQWVTGAGITVYLVHPSLMAAMAAFYPKLTLDPLLALGAVVLSIMLCLVVAELGERRRKHYTDFIRKLLR